MRIILQARFSISFFYPLTLSLPSEWRGCDLHDALAPSTCLEGDVIRKSLGVGNELLARSG
ncbi:MAG: hypothetical protein AAFP00_04890, partial [Bacteroidota bacterium]